MASKGRRFDGIEPEELSAVPTHRPDGLTQREVQILIWETYEENRQAPRPTSALLDGLAAERRFRRMERRAIAAVVRELPVRQQAGPFGSEAA